MELLYGLLAVCIVSAISLIGAVTLFIRNTKINSVLIYFVSFAAGAMFGDVFLHLIPELIEEGTYTVQTSLFVLSGIVISFILEKIIHWHHCHLPLGKQHVHSYAYMNIFGDMLHNFIDGLIIGAAFLAGLPVGIATTIAVILHEIPQEISDIAIMLHGGMKKTRALLINFLTALTAIAGLLIAFALNSAVENMNAALLAFAAGSFIYIAGSDLIPELHKEVSPRKNFIQLLLFVCGIGAMSLLLFVE